MQSLLKAVGGFYTGSLSMLGEAIHSLSDSFASLVAYISVRFSERKSQRFPYGLYKLENVGSTVIGIFLVLASYEIIKRAFEEEVKIDRNHLPLGISIIVLSLASSLILSLLERKAGKELNSPTLIADSYHTLTDALGSFLVLMSLVGSYLGYSLDRYFAVGVSLLILYTAIGIFKRELSVLLDVSVDEEILEQMRQTILEFEEVKEIKSLFVRSSGGRLFADITITITGNDAVSIHKRVDQIEMALKQKFPNLEAVFIHYEPIVEQKVAVLLDASGNVSKTFAEAKEILFLGDSIEKVKKVKNLSEFQIAKIIQKEKASTVICGQHPECNMAKAVLSHEGIFVWETDKKNPYEAVSEVLKYKENVNSG